MLGWSRARLVAHWRHPAPASFRSRYDALVDRRARREPAAHLLGRREFWGLELEVSPDVLVPRPETELLVEETLPLDGLERIVDAGTGSGCLAVALAHEKPSLHVVAVDRSHAALDLARRNAGRHRVSDRIRWVQSDWLTGLRGTFDGIVSNPPYVRTGDRDTLPPEVRDHEPPDALFAGEDGLDAIGRLLREGADRVRPGGWVVCEIGDGQLDPVTAMVSASPHWALARSRLDLRSIPRVVVCRRLT